ncbi:ATP-binding protein [Lysobacter sp. TY2-98]|uniref:sensor histidine kinase n=1 Tax=Lysobacter sp. TY2-98 TaxID=2290922 RepID=UPI0013B3D13F|nr:ATP-binding protein [Lysobacter sp. TY2-98]
MIEAITALVLLLAWLVVGAVLHLRRPVDPGGARSAWLGMACVAFAIAVLIIAAWSHATYDRARFIASVISLPAALALGASLWRVWMAGRVSPHTRRDDAGGAPRLAVVGELTASIAHEINQPLGAILSNTDAAEILLERPSPPLEDIRQILRDIRRDGLRAGGVIRNVRTLARQRKISFVPIDANALARETVQLLAPDVRGRGIPVEVTTSSGTAMLHGDSLYLQQMLLNLLINAMDAVEARFVSGDLSASRPPVLLDVRPLDSGQVQFQVSDAGGGIPESRLDHLFDSFYSSKPHGMGLGLSISRSIAEAHGGSIRAENNNRGGATFRVTFPPFLASEM